MKSRFQSQSVIMKCDNEVDSKNLWTLTPNNYIIWFLLRFHIFMTYNADHFCDKAQNRVWALENPKLIFDPNLIFDLPCRSFSVLKNEKPNRNLCNYWVLACRRLIWVWSEWRGKYHIKFFYEDSAKLTHLHLYSRKFICPNGWEMSIVFMWKLEV